MQSKQINKYTASIVRYRWIFIALILLVLTVCSLGLPKLYFDNTTRSFLIESDPALKNYTQFLDDFETDEYAIIILDAPQIWSRDYVNLVRTLNDEIRKLPSVKRVTSLVNVDHVSSVSDDILVEEFIPTNIDDKILAEKKAYALTNKIYRTSLINHDGSKLSIIIETNVVLGQLDHKAKLTHQLIDIGNRSELQALHFQIAGAPVMEAVAQEEAGRESALFAASVLVILTIGFYSVFRSVLGVVLPVGIAVLSLWSVFGLAGLTGMPLGVLSAIIPSFLLSVGVISSVYLLTQIYSHIAQGHCVESSLHEAMSSAALPCLLSALTTAGALLAFSSSSVKVVMEVGITMGLGLLFSIFYTLLLVPIVFSFIRSVKPNQKRNSIILARVDWLENIAVFATHHYRQIIVTFILAFILAAWGFSYLRVDFNYLGMFKPQSPIRSAIATIDREFGNTSAIEIILKTQNPGDIKEPAVMQLIDRLATAAEQYAGMPVKSHSIVDIVKEVNQVLHQGDARFFRIPESRDAIAQSLLLFEMGGGTDLNRLVINEYSTARLTLYVPNRTLIENRELIDYLNNYITSELQAPLEPSIKNLDVQVTGLVVLWETINSYLAHSQMVSMLLAMVIVSVVMIFLFRSFVLGLCMTLCNLFVVLVVLGFMGWQGIPLDPYTILVGAIALGVLDDDTIHFVKKFQEEYRLSGCPEMSIRNTFRSSGQAIFYTTSVLTLSFLTYLFSDVAGLNQYGMISSMAVALGMIVEFFLTPALLLWLHRLRPALSALPTVHTPLTTSAEQHSYN